MIPVTKPFLPPMEEYLHYVGKIWETQQLTNAGPLVQELELQLRSYFNSPYCFFMSNGTIALQIAIKAFELQGDIITTPFSYVATTSSISWEGCNPVFVDIEPDTLTIDPLKIEQAITPKTTAILVTHVYGNPCDVESIERIAHKYGLKTIYDAAHGFGVEYNGMPLVNYGDISILSFHATKLFHTVEGGAIICRDPEIAHKISYLRNFGHNGAEQFFGIGINGKNSEFHAAMGLCNLPYIDQMITRREALSKLYDSYLSTHTQLQQPKIRTGTKYNYSYYPILFQSEEALLTVQSALQNAQIYPRRYFYPNLTTLSYVTPQYTPIAIDVSSRVLCLPLYYTLEEKDAQSICQIILEALL